MENKCTLDRCYHNQCERMRIFKNTDGVSLNTSDEELHNYISRSGNHYIKMRRIAIAEKIKNERRFKNS